MIDQQTPAGEFKATEGNDVKSIDSVLINDGRENGVVLGMRRDEYDSIQRLNPSTIAAALVDHSEVDPLAAKFAFEGKRETSQASQDRMDRGTLMHLFMLQPDRIATDVAIWAGDSRRGAAWDAFQTENVGKLIVRSGDFAEVNFAYKAIRFHPEVNRLLTDLDAEVAILTKEGSIWCKGLVDAVTKGGFRRMIDLKTTEAGISQRKVEQTVRDFRYREKMAGYRRWYEREANVELDGSYLFFVSMTRPYALRIVNLCGTHEWGEMRFCAAVDSIETCLKSREWPIQCRECLVGVADWEQAMEGEEQLDWKH